MEKRIELEKRARKACQITDLNLDNCRSTSIVGLTDEYTALESLSLINVGLTTLKGFPKLPNLRKLELSDNRISNGLHYLKTSPLLESLNLSGNKIKDLETLKPLQEFKNLFVLDLFNNEATQINDYREKIFEMLPSLKFLDGFDCNDHEVSSEGDEDDEVNGIDSEDDVSEGMGEDDDDSDECEEDDDEDEDGEGDSENDNDVSLAEVYNDDLEEDNSDWAGDASGDDDVEDIDDVDDEEDENAGEANDSKAADKDADAEAEPQARGKKRKHEG